MTELIGISTKHCKKTKQKRCNCRSFFLFQNLILFMNVPNFPRVAAYLARDPPLKRTGGLTFATGPV